MLRQKQANWELRELDKLKDRIITNTSHELRTPLNGIIGLSDLILQEYENKVDDELIESIRLISKSGVRLSLIVNDILDLAQLKSRRIVFHFQPFNMSHLIKEVLSLCQPLIINDQVKIIFEEESGNFTIEQEKYRIQQVLFNLIGNAIKFTKEGKITIKCSLQDGFLWTYIEDTGIGIPKNKQSRLFEGFEQVDSGDNRQHQGSGLGLAICKEICIMLGGEINLHSEFGKGTLLSFSFPMEHLSQEKD